MNIIIPKDLLTFIYEERSYLSRSSYLIKCTAYLQTMDITLGQINNTLAAKYERADNDKFDTTGLEGENRNKSTV